jgi:hypothetical protein
MNIYKSIEKIKKNKLEIDFNIDKDEVKLLFKYAFEYMKTRENGKRIWIDKADGTKDYNVSTETNYPEWIRFYFEKTPKKERNKYEKWGDLGRKEIYPWENGYFNGNRKELLYTLENASNGKLPRKNRMLFILNEVYNNFEIDFDELENQKNIEEKNIEKINEEFNIAFEKDRENLNQDYDLNFNF